MHTGEIFFCVNIVNFVLPDIFYLIFNAQVLLKDCLCTCLTIDVRTLRVWNREGILSSTFETVDGLEQALFWK